MAKRTFSKDTIQKIQTFLEEFKKDPTQMVEPLCKQLHLGKSILYEWCREHNIVLANMRANHIEEKNTVKKTPAKPVVATAKSMDEMIAEIDGYRASGVRLPDAIKKAKSPDIQTVGKYYYYKEKAETGVKKKRSYTRGRKKPNLQAEDTPTTHTVVEYVEKPAKKKQELLMMMGTPEALLEFVKKMQGV